MRHTALMWSHMAVNSLSDEACCELLYPVTLLLLYKQIHAGELSPVKCSKFW